MRAGRGSAREYWDSVGRSWTSQGQDALWRRCSDAIHFHWLERAACETDGGLVLKTDLFDEAFGDGLAEWFGRRGCRVVGSDLAFSTARKASGGASQVGVVVSDVRTLPFAAGQFDCVLSDSTLDHWADSGEIVRALGELSRVLRPGGLLLLTMDNPRNWAVRLRNQAPGFWRRIGIVPYEVGVTCGAEELAGIVEQAGFEVVQAGGLMHSPRVAVVAACRLVQKWRAVMEPSAKWVQRLQWMERLERLPSRWLTAHFVAIVGRRKH